MYGKKRVIYYSFEYSIRAIKFFLMVVPATGNSRSWALGRKEYGIFLTGEAVGAAHGAHWIGFVKINCYPDPRKSVQSKHFQTKNQDVQACSLPPECAFWHQSLQIPTKLSRHM